MSYDKGDHVTIADDFEAQVDEDQQAALSAALRRAQRQIQKLKARNDELAAVTIDACRDAVVAYAHLTPAAVPPRDARRKGAETALWVMTDWQGAKVTTSYNSEVMRERVLRFAQKARRLTEIQRADHPVTECTILFGGDMVEGLFNFPTQPFEIDATIFVQYVSVAMLMTEVVKSALETYDKVQVVAEWGNHGRIGSKRDAVPRNDNFDRMSYELARQIMKDEPRLTWEDCPEDIQRVEIGAYRALLIHGDEVGRSGFASHNTILAHVNRWQSGAYQVNGERWPFRDVYGGHYHTHLELGLANGEGSYYQTGSTESDNRYARDMLAAASQPSQRLHFIDPVAGVVTAQYKVRLES